MQTRIKEIRDRVDRVYSYYRKYRAEDQLIQQDIPYLLAALQEAQDNNIKLKKDFNKEAESYIKKIWRSQDRERVLREALETSERHKQLFCDEMNVYKNGCAVLEAERDREIESNDELRKKATYWHKIEMENFKLSREIRELNEALGQEGK